MQIEAKIIADSISEEGAIEARPVRGYEGLYEVSRNGEVTSLQRVGKGGRQKVPRRARKAQVRPHGYSEVRLAKDGRVRSFRVHRLVAEAFLTPDPARLLVNHINGNKSDNRAENLEWVTPQENTDHAMRSGRIDFAGVKNPSAKLSGADIVAAKARVEAGAPLQDIAQSFGVNRNTVPKALDRTFGRAWRQAQKPQYRRTGVAE